MKRRDFLRATAATLAATAFGDPTWLYADGQRYNVLVLYFRGGVDMLWSTPVRSGDAYTRLSQIRPNIHVQAGDILVPNGTANSAQQIGLHKAWRRLHETATNNIRIVTKVGVLAYNRDNPNKSHADCQTVTLSGQLNLAVALGLVGKAHTRYNLGLLNTIGFGGNGTEELYSPRGDILNLYSFGNYAENSRTHGTHYCDDYRKTLTIWNDNIHQRRTLAQLKALDTEGNYVEAFRAAKEALANSLSDVNNVIKPTTLSGDYRRYHDDANSTMSDSGFGNLCKDVAKFFKAPISRNTRIAQLSVGGWDTHASQVGSLVPRTQEVAGGLRGLIDDMKTAGLWNRTIILCMSEFGRTAAENGSTGTDHGWGSNSLIMSGAFSSKIIGESFTPNDFNPVYHFIPTVSYFSPINEVFKYIGMPLENLIDAPLTAPNVGLFS